MGELWAVGCSHSPYLLEKPEAWGRWRSKIIALCRSLNPDFQDPPQLIEEVGSNAEAEHWKRCLAAYEVLKTFINSKRPDALIVVGDDQAENFTPSSVPTFAVYVGSSVDGYPFYNAPQNNWDEPMERRYVFRCHRVLAKTLLRELVREGFDLCSSNDFSRGLSQNIEEIDERVKIGLTVRGLSHAHLNPLVFLNKDGEIPVVPLIVNCYSSDAGEDFPPGPTPLRCYQLGQSLERILRSQKENVVIVASSSWSHIQLAKRTGFAALDEDFDRRNLRLIESGEGERLAALSSEEIEMAGDHEFRNWIVTAGVMGKRNARIVDAFPSYCSTSFKVFALWE